MPSPARPSGKQWFDLPVGLQANILSHLCKEKRSSQIKMSLDGVTSVVNPLPNDILSAAQVSEDFAALVADTLGRRAAYLTKDVAKGKLLEWVSVLAPFVKAISMWERGRWNRGTTSPFLNAICEESLRLFKPLSEETVALEILDLKDVPFGKYGRNKDDLLNGLISVFQHSCGSLKELALPVAKVCATALAKTAFPKLDVFAVEYNDIRFRLVTKRMKTLAFSEFMNMLRSLDAHNTGSERINTPRDLRLNHVRIARTCIPQPDSKPLFFETVKTLHVKLFESRRGESNCSAMFVALFPELRCLRWSGATTSSHIQVINEGCPEIEELHLRPYFGSKLMAFRHDDPVEMDIGLEDSIRSIQGKIKTLVLTTSEFVTAERLKIVGERCPDLEHLGVEVGYDSVDGLGFLLKDCRHIRRLEISFEIVIQRILRLDDWGRLTHSVLAASDELCEIRLTGLRDGFNDPESFEALVQFIVDIIEFLGSRARRVEVSLFFLIPVAETMVNPMCRILRTCATHTKRLQDLHVNFETNDEGTWSSVEEQKNSLLLILKEKRDLVEMIPSLEVVQISLLDDEMLQILEQNDERI